VAPSRTTTRATNRPPRFATLSHPPRPFPLGRGASRPLSSGVQAARRFACFSCPLPVSVGPFQGRQGFASPSGVARVLAFGCGPRQPPLRPLTPFPLENQKPRRARWRGRPPGRDGWPALANIEGIKTVYPAPLAAFSGPWWAVCTAADGIHYPDGQNALNGLFCPLAGRRPSVTRRGRPKISLAYRICIVYHTCIDTFYTVRNTKGV
jgi:hypothetical protein